MKAVIKMYQMFIIKTEAKYERLLKQINGDKDAHHKKLFYSGGVIMIAKG